MKKISILTFVKLRYVPSFVWYQAVQSIKQTGTKLGNLIGKFAWFIYGPDNDPNDDK